MEASDESFCDAGKIGGWTEAGRISLFAEFHRGSD